MSPLLQKLTATAALLLFAFTGVTYANSKSALLAQQQKKSQQHLQQQAAAKKSQQHLLEQQQKQHTEENSANEAKAHEELNAGQPTDELSLPNR